ncbi:hypothetical protein HYH02_011370 [Chlamydomonas schloesseri]|uniref:Core domain-containing protein n=1 Tax=Chlamydomonas schloesseri TaxID=2026947 RepID=A0A835W4T4_9CHLO|nr:hypothetical protein HYH02_011370 [Chlamydomonas schloesseri]|eukprot:KAG2437114.1 hypothetical protein HYH02_011370 [Chlamydomonas schloesseri]
MLGRAALRAGAALAERVLSGSLAEVGSQGISGVATLAAATVRATSAQQQPWLQRELARSAWASSIPAFRLYSSAASPELQPESQGLVIHPSAAARLRELQAEKPGGEPLVLRIEVEGGGCSGFQYKFKLDGQAQEGDVVYDTDGGRVVCDTISLEFLKGATLEFEDTLMRAAFTISKNPNAEASCGCGSSFAAKMK